MSQEKIKIKDIIHGEVVIDELVAVELIESQPMQRLKGIDQGGYAPAYSSFCDSSEFPHTRFEHSIGVYLLLKKYNDSLESQISGLIHDVSHSAFSHTVDYVFDSGCQKSHKYQDDIHEQFVNNSIIPSILKKYKLDKDRIIYEANFTLLENDIPDICADRLDYSLRDTLHFQVLNRDKVNNLLNHLKTQDGKWYFDDLVHGQRYADLFKLLNDKYYSGLVTAVMFFSLQQLMKYSLLRDYIREEDFWQDDEYVLDKIRNYLDKDAKLEKLYYNIHHPEIFKQVEEGNDPIYLKSRIVDPWVMQDNKLKRLSEINKDWGKIVKEDLKPKKYYIEIDKNYAKNI